MAGIKYLNRITEQSFVSSHFTFTNSANESYDIRYASTSASSTDKQSGKIVVGPFKAGDITIAGIEYTGTDFNRETVIGRDKYYVVGDINYITDKIDFDLGALGKESTNFTGAYIELEAKPIDKNIYVKDGSLLVFENDLRPNYTNISLEPITL